MLIEPRERSADPASTSFYVQQSWTTKDGIADAALTSLGVQERREVLKQY